MKCPSCGADNSPHAAVCAHCEARLPRQVSNEKSTLFEHVKSSREYQQRSSPDRHTRLPKHHAAHKIFLFVFFAFFIGMSLFIFVFALGMAGIFGLVGGRAGGPLGSALSLIPLLMAIVPLAFIVFGIVACRHMYQRMKSMETGPVEALAVIVVDKRTHVSGGGETSARTSYFATCEMEDGQRKEFELWDGKLYSLMSAGDGGILFVRSGHGLDFDRVVH